MVIHDCGPANQINVPPVSLFIEMGIGTFYVYWWYCARLKEFVPWFLGGREEELEEGEIREETDMYRYVYVSQQCMYMCGDVT